MMDTIGPRRMAIISIGTMEKISKNAWIRRTINGTVSRMDVGNITTRTRGSIKIATIGSVNGEARARGVTDNWTKNAMTAIPDVGIVMMAVAGSTPMVIISIGNVDETVKNVKTP